MEKLQKLATTKRVFAVVGMAVGGVIIAAVIALLLGVVVMKLWNWLMPDIFGLGPISFWQAWGLVLLSHILFKSFPHHDRHNHDERWKRHFREKFGSKKEPDQQAEPGPDAV